MLPFDVPSLMSMLCSLLTVIVRRARYLSCMDLEEGKGAAGNYRRRLLTEPIFMSS